MHVTKMHGARNDFVVIDTRVVPLNDVASFARWACDRRAGIGADGCIVLETSSIADVRMRTINSDGSEAEMCGNGVRCAARWLAEAGEGERLAFDTDAGIIHTEIVAKDPEYLVRVGIGRPSVGGVLLQEPDAFVDLGNPHVVLFRNRLEDVNLEAAADELNNDSRFPAGTNVHVAVRNGARSMHVRHWERGVGLTMACGTGAVACAAVGIERGIVGSPVEVFVPGGRLVVEWNGSGEAYLIGPAVRVFDTDVNPRP